MKRFLVILLTILLTFLSGCKLMLLAYYNPKAVVTFMADQEAYLMWRLWIKEILSFPIYRKTRIHTSRMGNL
jgi:hypothetical protein